MYNYDMTLKLLLIFRLIFMIFLELISILNFKLDFLSLNLTQIQTKTKLFTQFTIY